jgi:hypothetical protein
VPLASLLQGEARLRPVERLDLARLIDGQDDGMDRRRDVKADDIVKLLGKSLVIQQFEAAPAMWRTSMLMPDLDDRRGCNPNSLRHRANGPVRGLLPRRFKCKGDDAQRVRHQEAQCQAVGSCRTGGRAHLQT